LEKNILYYAAKLVAKKFDKGPIENWNDITFKELSNDIMNETKTKVDIETLMFILGKLNNQKENKSQRETKLAIAKYIGFDSWSEFVEKAEMDLGIQSIQNSRNEEKYYWIAYASAAFILLAALAIVILIYSK